MNAIPPLSLPSLHSRISGEIADSVLSLPIVVTNLIADYADENSFAEQPLELDSWGKVMDSEANCRILAAIKKVLIGTNDPERKKIIFNNLRNVGVRYEEMTGKTFPNNLIAEANCRAIFNNLFDEIRSEGARVNLDFTDFTNTSFLGLNLTGASAVGAKFIDGTCINNVWTGADLTAALFQDTCFNAVEFDHATLIGSIWNNCHLTDCSFRNADMRKICMFDMNFERIALHHVVTDNAVLRAIVDDCSPPVQIEVNVNVYLQGEPVAHAQSSNCLLSATRLTL